MLLYSCCYSIDFASYICYFNLIHCISDFLGRKLMTDSDDVCGKSWYFIANLLIWSGVTGHTDLMEFLYNFILYQNPAICNLFSFWCSQMTHKGPYFLSSLGSASRYLTCDHRNNIFLAGSFLFYFLHICIYNIYVCVLCSMYVL